MPADDTGLALAWLAGHGVTRTPDGNWTHADSLTYDTRTLTANDVAHEWASGVDLDTTLDAVQQLRLLLGLLDLLDVYAVAMCIGVEHKDTAGLNMIWSAYRRRLEAPESAESITYSLWVDWFEDRTTAPAAFAEMLGDTIADLAKRGMLTDLATGPLARRASRVLAVSGPVPWPVKHDAYLAAATVPELHPALYQGLLGSHYDVYGGIEPHAALLILERLQLPDDTDYLPDLRAALRQATGT